MGDFRLNPGNVPRRLVLAVAGFACVCVGVGFGAAAQAPAGKTMLVEPPAPLLPATLSKMHRAAEGDSGDGLGSVDPADATILQEDGLRRFARSDYGNSNGKDFVPLLNLTVYQFADASGAISAYDYFLKPGMRREKLGDDSASKGDELLMRSGKDVVVERSRVDHTATAALTNELIEHLPKAMGASGIAPLLPTLLPSKDLDADTVKYALGPAGYQAMGGVLRPDVVGFDKSAETVTARYKNGGVLTLLLYPTPEIAGDHERAIEAQVDQKAPAATQGAGAAGAAKLRRDGPLVVMTTGSWTAAAQKLMDGVRLHQEVSFDKPMPLEFHAEVQKTYSLLESIAIFCAFSAVAMVVLALFLGGGRAAIRVMQGKPAATEPEFLHIDLSGPGGKRLRGPEA